jgi:hypothetical protein|tara:strand:+ start:4526 stop:4966 length:441 start_codon:yes stop_codon:yes gene_type:complete
MAHQIVWCTVATVDAKNRPRSRILHPIWEWDGENLVGWIATGKTPVKAAHIAISPNVSCNYWAPTQDTCLAECAANWVEDQALKNRIWDLFANGPAPVGYDPAMIPGWENASSPGFDPLRLDPWRIRVMPGSALMDGSFAGEVWQQ